MTPAPVRTADVHVLDLVKRYETAIGGVLAMADVTLDIPSGEFVAVVGASGCGKSTLLRILAGFEEATEGVVEVGGVPVASPVPIAAWCSRTTGSSLAERARERGLRAPAQEAAEGGRDRGDRPLHRGGAAHALRRPVPGELSGGMQQRVAIARVLANEPSVLLMDEPFGALDALTRLTCRPVLKRIHRETRTTVLFVTHSIEEAVYLADRVVVMTGGASHGVPGHISEIVPIALPEERDVTTPEFNEYKRRISELVHAPA